MTPAAPQAAKPKTGGQDASGQARSSQAGASQAALAQSVARLDAALKTLESVVDGHLEHHVDNAAAAAEVQRLNADRARVARALDEAEARAGRLDGTNREVSRRLVGAMETVRAIIEKPARR